MYEDRLVTFPGIGGPPSVSHVLVQHIPEVDGQEESSSAEVSRVVELVLQHVVEHRGKSLGVISMGIQHAMRLQSALDRAQAEQPGLAEFFDPGRPDRFFVKNLERVQGDERDCIILSVGYGKDRGGNLPLRFGPILAAGGMRRLNVAVTRARETMTVVSSFAHTDIDMTKVREGTGLEFLRNYLQYAASNGRVLAGGKLTSEPMNDFEADIYEALSARGLKLVSQVGCSQFRSISGFAIRRNQAALFLRSRRMVPPITPATQLGIVTGFGNKCWKILAGGSIASGRRIGSSAGLRKSSARLARTKMQSLFQMGGRQEHQRITVHEPEPQIPLEELSAKRTSIFPPLAKRANIGDYTSREMTALFEWVTSDGQLRTHDEIAEEMFLALPFSRRGSRIEAVLRETIGRCQAKRAV